MVEKTAAFRQRRAADTARWRERLDAVLQLGYQYYVHRQRANDPEEPS
jgi:hypothetical protein